MNHKTIYLIIILTCIIIGCSNISNTSQINISESPEFKSQNNISKETKFQTEKNNMTIQPENQSIYTINQDVDLTYQETDETSILHEKYSRYGIITLEQLKDKQHNFKRFNEYIISKIDFNNLNINMNNNSLNIEKIKNQSKLFLEKNTHEIEFGLNQKELELYEFSPLKFDQIYLPTIFNTDNNNEGNISLEFGTNIIPLKFKINNTNYNSNNNSNNNFDTNLSQIVVDDNLIIQKMSRFTLTIEPKGKIIIETDPKSRNPKKINGNYSYIIFAKGLNIDDVEVNVKIIDYNVEFELNKI